MNLSHCQLFSKWGSAEVADSGLRGRLVQDGLRAPMSSCPAWLHAGFGTTQGSSS